MKTILALSLLVLLASCASLNMTCGDCSASANCTGGVKCYTLTGTDFDEEVCAETTTCAFDTTLEYDVFDCKSDFMGGVCTEEICVGIAG